MAIKSKIKTTKAKLVNKDIVKIAGIQMASGPDIKSNLNEAENLITIAANQGAKLIALPEYFSIMSAKDSEKLKAREKPDQGLVQSFLSKQAKKHKVWIVGGSIPLVSKDKNKIETSTAGELRKTINELKAMLANRPAEPTELEKLLTR